VFDQFKIAVDAERRVLVQRVEGGKKDAVAQLDGHGGVSSMQLAMTYP
jgi:hypothetical protein